MRNISKENVSSGVKEVREENLKNVDVKGPKSHWETVAEREVIIGAPTQKLGAGRKHRDGRQELCR